MHKICAFFTRTVLALVSLGIFAAPDIAIAAEPRAFCTATSRAERSQPIIALVVAISDYNGDGAVSRHNEARFLSDLPNAVSDGEAVAQVLCTTGADVLLITDPDRDSLVSAIGTFVRRLAENPQAASIFYYSGHAMQVSNHNWLLPNAASLRTDRDLAREPDGVQETMIEGQGVRLQLILTSLSNRVGNSINLVIVDACRDNPWDRLWGRTRGSVGLAGEEPFNRASVIVSFSTYAGGLASDGPARGNSPFASAFVSLAPQRGLEIRDLLRQVDNRVRESTSGRQSVVTIASSGQPLYLAGSLSSASQDVAASRSQLNSAAIPTEAEILAGARCVYSNVPASDRRRYEELAEQDEPDPLAMTSTIGRLASPLAVCRGRLTMSDQAAIAVTQLVQAVLMRPIFRAALREQGVSSEGLERWYRQQPAEFRNIPVLDPERIRDFLRRQNLGADQDGLDMAAMMASQYLQAFALEERLRVNP